MTTKPNTKDSSHYANNYFYIHNDMYIYEIGLRNIGYNDEEIEFIYSNRRISAPVPSSKELDEYPCLSESIEQKLMDEGVPYDDIEKIIRYFKVYEKEMIENILRMRRR